MSRYILVPVDDGDIRNLIVPNGIVCSNVYESLKCKVKDVKKLKSLIKDLSKNEISEGEDGSVVCRDINLKSINLRDVLRDICNSKFHEKYEEFYEMLRKFDIIF